VPLLDTEDVADIAALVVFSVVIGLVPTFLLLDTDDTDFEYPIVSDRTEEEEEPYAVFVVVVCNFERLLFVKDAAVFEIPLTRDDFVGSA